jgi:hypothetical protein
LKSNFPLLPHREPNLLSLLASGRKAYRLVIASPPKAGVGIPNLFVIARLPVREAVGISIL